jgi:hypothetical protein
MNKLTRKKLLLTSIGLLAINLLITFILFRLDNAPYEHLDGQEIAPQSSELIWTLMRGQLISFPIFSFLIGLIVALFIDKNLPYSQRIVRSFLLTLTVIYGFLAAMGLTKILNFM